MLAGKDAVDKLKSSTVAIFGIGGVGGDVAEALARSGVGNFVLVDNDTVSVTNLNRQIIALHSSIGKYKTEVMADRIRDINPNAQIEIKNTFFLPENSEQFDFNLYDYVADCIDTVTAKLELIMRCREAGTPIISAMGAGGKLDPSRFEVEDISKTSVCPLCKVMRRELKARGINHLKVVYSKEPPAKPQGINSTLQSGSRHIPGSSAFCPSAAGLVMASEIVKDLTGI